MSGAGVKMEKTAQISACGLYRYELTRRWGDDSICTFVMLNPSTADAENDDPTIRRCVGFSKWWGYGGLRVVNLYAYRATNPSQLALVQDPFGPENAFYLESAAKGSACVVAAWGAYKEPLEAMRILSGVPMYCLGLTKKGNPRHPLYIQSSVKLSEFKVLA